MTINQRYVFFFTSKYEYDEEKKKLKNCFKSGFLVGVDLSRLVIFYADFLRNNNNCYTTTKKRKRRLALQKIK